MKVQVFTILDTKTGIHLQPFCSTNIQSAKRMFINSVNDKQTTMGKNPEDYILFHLGEYDDETGMVLHLTEGKQSLGYGTDFTKLSDNPLLKEQQT